ncbi:MAG: glycosyltransferase [Xanthobacteraceae bacterium]
MRRAVEIASAVTSNAMPLLGRRPPTSGKFDVVFVLPHMSRGGAQRVASLVANAWSRKGWRICILTWIDGRDEAHSLDPGVARIHLSQFVAGVVGRRWTWRWPWRRIRFGVRGLERLLRPSWQWLGMKGTFANTFGGGSTPHPTSTMVKPTRRIRRLRFHAARILLALDQRFPILPASRNLARVAGPPRRPSKFAVRRIIGRRPLVQRVLAKSILEPRVDSFRDALAEFDAPVVVSMLTRSNIYVVEATRNLPCRVVVSERNDPDLQEIDPLWNVLRKISYREADTVTSNAAGVLAKMSKYVPASKLKLLPNPVVLPMPKQVGSRARRFVTVTRLVHQKGIDLLLAAFADIAGELEDWSLDIVGDGPLRAELIAYAERSGISNRVTFHGYVQDPFELLRAGRIFVLPSRFEGMPNSLLEAMACGLAPIVSDASPGPLECVTNYETGLVVVTENTQQLAAAMRVLAKDDELTDRLAQCATVRAREYDWPMVEPLWLEVVGLPAIQARG